MSDPNKVKILLVDDQPSRLLSYEAILGDLGQELVRVTSGADALQRLMQDDFAVILLDVNMPGMDGFETATLIHQHPRFEKTPIIFVTALHVTDLDRLKGYELGAVDYVYIPVVPEILRSKVSVLVELYTKRRELQRLNESLRKANAELAEKNLQLQAQKTRELQDLNQTLAKANEELGRANAQLRAEVRVRRRAEEAMRRSEERLSTVLQNTSALIYQMDTEGRFVHVNRMFEELFHVSNDDVRGKSARDIFPADVAEAFETNNRAVLDESRRMEFEESLVFADGLHVLSSIKAPIQEREGEPSGLVGVSTDITERKRLEEALKEADRRKDEFLAMLAHELRNPLAPIHNSLQLMQMKGTDDPEITWCRGVIENQTKQLTRLVDDLMDVSRITQGKFKLQKEPVEISAAVANAIQISQPLIEARHHQLSVELPEHPVRVEADPTRLAQVIGNLLNNAAKYTNPGGKIRLSVDTVEGPSSSRGEVVISVRDSGMGISSEMLPKLFELFTQLDRTLERAEGGLGVGLALVRRLVVLHGGSVSVHSEGAGKGSEFVVRLPLLSTERKPELKQADRKPARTMRRILVVDDNVDSAISLSLILKRSGNDVETAHDGLAGIELADKFRPEVVLLDIGMPKMNGYDAARAIREQPWGKEVFLIALTGWGQDEVRARIFEAGFDVHMIKPVDPAALTNMLVALPSEQPKALKT